MPEEIKTEEVKTDLTGGGDTDPQKTGTTDNTKAYSTLHNEFKEYRTKAETDAALLNQKVDDLLSQVQAKKDGDKTVEELTAELAALRPEADALKTGKVSNDAEMKALLESAIEGLTDDQKALVENASEDSFKRLKFIQTLKAQTVAPVVKTSQGGSAGGDNPADIDIDFINKESAQGNLKPYREAKIKYGEKKLKEYIQANTAIAGTAPRKS